MGKSSRGKTLGKVAFTVAGFFVGGMNPSWFGATKFLPAAIMGASLGGTLWSLATARRNKMSNTTSSAQRFDKAMNTMSSTAAIQVVYGTRLVEGNQTYHNPNPELNMLDKHVVLCEGGIEGLMSVMAAGLPVPASEPPSRENQSLTDKTVFTISNTQYENASVEVTSTWSQTQNTTYYYMKLKYREKEETVMLGGVRRSNVPPYISARLSSQFGGGNEFKALYDYINELGDGWVAENFFDIGSDYKLASIPISSGDCYQKTFNVEVEGHLEMTRSSGGTVFMVTNTKHSDSKIKVSGHKMELYCNGAIYKTIKLGAAEDYDNSDFAQYELDIGSLVSYINRIGEGWIAFPFASTNKLPHDIWEMEEECYNVYVKVKTDFANGETWYKYHDGDQPENYEEVGGYGGCAWLDMHFTVSEELNGNPNIDVVLEGRRVYDTRIRETVYSTNPAMCLRDFLLNEVFGVGWKGGLDEESFIEAANYCDELIEYVDAEGTVQTRKRYELNLILDQQEDAESAVSKFLSACCGFLVRYRWIIGMRIEKPTAPSYVFTEEQIVKDSFSISQIGLDETPNKYIINIISPENNWRATRCIVEDTGMQEVLGYIQEESIDLDGVTSQHQALRIGRFYRDLNTVCNKVISFSTASQAMHLQPGDVILVSYYQAIEKMPFRIITIKEEGNGVFAIEGRQYCEDIYNDALGAEIHAGFYTPAASTSDSSKNKSDYEGGEYVKIDDAGIIDVVTVTEEEIKAMFE